MNKNVIKKLINENWSYGEEKKYNMKDVRSLHNYLKDTKENKWTIDDTTYEDIDMDQVFYNLDRTITRPGEQYLYYLLRRPLIKYEELKIRKDNLETFGKDKNKVKEIQEALYPIRMRKKGDILNIIEGKLQGNKKKLILFSLWGFLVPILILLSSTLIGIKAMIVAAAYISINTAYYYRKEASTTNYLNYPDEIVNGARDRVFLD